MRLKAAFGDFDLVFMSTPVLAPPEIGDARYISVPDANMWSKPRMVWLLCHVAFRLFFIRPKVIVTTGAAPGFFAILVGNLLGRKTIWIDSIANVDELSLAGKKASRWASIWLTQWPHLATENGPKYIGSVI